MAPIGASFTVVLARVRWTGETWPKHLIFAFPQGGIGGGTPPIFVVEICYFKGSFKLVYEGRLIYSWGRFQGKKPTQKVRRKEPPEAPE